MNDLQILPNLRYALRRLSKSPGFTLTAIFSLALGIGANTAIFTLVNAVLLRKAPIQAPEQVVQVYQSTPDFAHNVFSHPDLEDLEEALQELTEGVVGSQLIITQADHEGGVETLVGEAVSGNYFSVLGLEAEVGRTLLKEDDLSPGAHPVVVLGYDHWQKNYGGDRGVVGEEIRLGGRAYTVVGVVSQKFTGTLRGLVPALYAPRQMINELQPGATNTLEARGNHSVFVKARLRSGVTMAQVQGVADNLAQRNREAQLDGWDPDTEFHFVPENEVIVFPPFDRFLRAASGLLMVVVALVLLMACTNLASFLLARSLDRRKEIAVRLAMGASRRSLVGQLLTETTLLSLAGGLAGVGLSLLALRLLTTADLPLPLPIDLDLRPDAVVLAFSLFVSLLAGFFLGMAPALQNLRGDMAQTLRSEGAGAGQGGKLRLRNALVVAQVAISLLLLLTSGLFLRSMDRIQRVDPGFGQEPTALMSFLIPATRFEPEEGRQLARRLVEEFEGIPGVQAVGLTGNLHLNMLNTQTMGVQIEGVEPPEGRDGFTIDRAVVDEGFFSAAGIPILEGRAFGPGDGPETQPVAIISQAMARKFWPGEDENGPTQAVGQKIGRGEGDEDLLVVGVARDAKVRSLGEAPRAFVYRPLEQSYSSFLTVVARTSMEPEKTALELLQTARQVEPELFAWETKTMERHLGIVLLPSRLSAFVLSLFAVLALVLAVVGLYGIVSYAVVQRRREVGIRLSLGAEGKDVVGLLLGAGLRLVAAGCGLGLVLGLATARLLDSLLFGIDALDPVTFLVFPGILLLTSALAALLPAAQARRVEPASVLRAE